MDIVDAAQFHMEEEARLRERLAVAPRAVIHPPVCKDCGEVIPAPRAGAYPRCVECQAVLEIHQARGTAREHLRRLGHDC